MALGRRRDCGDLEPALGRNKGIDGQDTCLKMGLEMEAVGEKRLAHGAVEVNPVVALHLLHGGFEVAGGLGVDAIGVLVEPVGAVDDLRGVDGAVGVHDVAADAERTEGDAGRQLEQ
jgi:hypothetical protein